MTFTQETEQATRYGQRREGTITRETERMTSQAPSMVYLGAAVASMVASAVLQIVGRKELSLFIGQWAPSILIMGVYNKLVKVGGSD